MKLSAAKTLRRYEEIFVVLYLGTVLHSSVLRDCRYHNCFPQAGEQYSEYTHCYLSRKEARSWFVSMVNII